MFGEYVERVDHAALTADHPTAAAGINTGTRRGAQLIYLTPEGIAVPPAVVCLPIEPPFMMPLFVLWSAGRPSPAARRITAALDQSVRTSIS